jgi:hypothetical protein
LLSMSISNSSEMLSGIRYNSINDVHNALHGSPNRSQVHLFKRLRRKCWILFNWPLVCHHLSSLCTSSFLNPMKHLGFHGSGEWYCRQETSKLYFVCSPGIEEISRTFPTESKSHCIHSFLIFSFESISSSSASLYRSLSCSSLFWLSCRVPVIWRKLMCHHRQKSRFINYCCHYWYLFIMFSLYM